MPKFSDCFCYLVVALLILDTLMMMSNSMSNSNTFAEFLHVFSKTFQNRSMIVIKNVYQGKLGGVVAAAAAAGIGIAAPN